MGAKAADKRRYRKYPRRVGRVGERSTNWVDEIDDRVNPLGIKRIGEIGIVRTAAAIANAVWHATGVRHRRLRVRPDRVLEALR
jgi:CO/xanthine dehydrogenase Mo-binding subunit